MSHSLTFFCIHMNGKPCLFPPYSEVTLGAMLL
jgi:hypothetical protein